MSFHVCGSGSAALGMIVQEIPFGFVERLAASCLVGHILITYVGSLQQIEMYRIPESIQRCPKIQHDQIIRFC